MPPVSKPDDPTVTRALWWTIFALVLAVVATLFFLLKGMSAHQAVSAPSSSTDIPAVTFTDITAAANIRFIHRNGALGEKLLPETMGGGVAFFDLDNDDRQDLLFVNSSEWPGRGTTVGKPATMALYRNLGGGRFEDITSGSGLDVTMYGMGVAVGDYDNDGRVDVFLTGVGGNRLFRNEGGGKFRDVTSQAGVGGGVDGWSTSAAWIDYDRDGRLDLFVCNYVRWSREIDFAVDYKLPGIGRAYGPPERYQGTLLSLYHNDGNGIFHDVSAESGIYVNNRATGQPMAKALGVVPVDLDADGWIDLVVANDTAPNFVFHNQQGTGFKEVGELSGAAFDPYGKPRGAMGIDAARFGDAQELAVAIGNFANEMTALYVSKRDSLAFADEAISRGIGGASRPFLTFGVFFFDYDLDGRLDLLTTNGHIEDQITRVQPSQQYRQPAQLFWNAGGKMGEPAFVPVPAARTGHDLIQPIVGRGSAYADIDGDGDLDVVMTQISGPPILLRNDQKLNHHWIRLKLVGAKSNRDAIGAWIKLATRDNVVWRQVMPTRSYLSQSELPVTVGLGASDRITGLTITWPSGRTQKVESPAVDQTVMITEEAK
jgi:enediyne biosynthesis protein E4